MIAGRNGKHLKRSETESGNQGKGLTLIKKIIMMMIHQTTPIHDTKKKKEKKEMHSRPES